MKAISLPWLLKPIQRVDFPHKLGVCERLFRNRLAREGICWVQTGARIPWKLDLVNSTHRWIVYGKYEGSGFLNWARKFLPRDGIVVDAGANVGQMLVYIAQWVPQGKVLAFEPGRKQADWLRECLAFHNELPVEIIRCGLGAGPATLYLRDEGAQLKHGAQSYVSEIDGEPIKIVRLADELTNRSI